MPHPIFLTFWYFLCKKCQKVAWKLDFWIFVEWWFQPTQKIMAQRTFVFPNFVSDHDGIPHKWKFTLYLMHFVKFVDFHFPDGIGPRCPCRTQFFFDFLILSMQKVAWKLDFCWMMILADKKWWLKEPLCFQILCQITAASHTNGKITWYLIHVVKVVDFHFSRWHRP